MQDHRVADIMTEVVKNIPITKVTVAQGVQCVNDGTVYLGGETADVPPHVAQFWIRSGWASEVKAKPKPAR